MVEFVLGRVSRASGEPQVQIEYLEALAQPLDLLAALVDEPDVLGGLLALVTAWDLGVSAEDANSAGGGGDLGLEDRDMGRGPGGASY